jgi:cytoskeletal protein CcmA (bactofilin family)
MKDYEKPQGAGMVRENAPVQWSVLSQDIKIKGDLISKGHVEVHGLLEGKINAEKITVNKTGVIKGNLKAESIEIIGTVDGKITCVSLTLRSSAVVQADTEYADLRIEAGAKLDGNFSKPKTLAAPKATKS